MFRSLFATTLAMFLGTAAWAAGDDGLVRISGSTSVANSIVLPHQAEIERAAGTKVSITPNSSGAGVNDLFAGKVEIAMISSDLDEILTKMSRAVDAYKVDKSQLRTFSLGDAKVVFIVNESNTLRKLSNDQIKGIFLGTLSNWKDVGGSAATIEAFTESRHGAMRTMVEDKLLGGRPVSDLVTDVSEAPEVARAVARSPQAIGFISSTTPAALRKGTATVETDTQIVQHLTLVTQGEPQGQAKRVIEAVAGFHQ